MNRKFRDGVCATVFLIIATCVFSGATIAAPLTPSQVKEQYLEKMTSAAEIASAAKSYLETQKYSLELLEEAGSKYAYVIKLRSHGQSASSIKALKTLNQKFDTLSTQIDAIKTSRLQKLEGVGEVGSRVGNALTALDIANDALQFQSRVDSGSNEAAEYLNMLLKAVETQIPSFPLVDTPSDVGRAMLDLVMVLKERDISLLELMKQRNAQVVNIIVHDKDTIKAQLSKKLEGETELFDQVYHGVYERRQKYLTDLIAQYVDDIKFFRETKAEKNFDPVFRILLFWKTSEVDAASDAFFDSLISNTEANIRALEQEKVALGEMHEQGFGYDLVLAYAARHFARVSELNATEAFGRLRAAGEQVAALQAEFASQIQLSADSRELAAGKPVTFSAITATAAESVSVTVFRDIVNLEVGIPLQKTSANLWVATHTFTQPGVRTITAFAKDSSGKLLGNSQELSVTVKPAEAKPPIAVVTAVTATPDNIKLNGSVDFVANVSGALADGDQVKLMLDNWSTVMQKVGNRWMKNTVGIDEAINGKRTYSAHVIGKNGLSSASTQPKQITVVSPITIKSVVVKKDKQDVEINNCVLGDNVDFFVTTTGATKGITELFLVMDGQDYAMKSADEQTWTFKAWIGEAPGGKRNYTAYARHKGTLSARPGIKSLFVAPRTRVSSIEAFMNDRPTSTFSSGTPIKFVVKLDGQTDGKVVVMLDQFKMEIAKPDANGNWTASAPIWDKDGKTRNYWAYVEEGYLTGPSSPKKTLKSNSDQPNKVDCGQQQVKVGDTIRLRVTTGNGGYNIEGTLSGAAGGKDMRFNALNDVVWEWAHRVTETKKGVLTAELKIFDKPTGGKLIDSFTCGYAFNGAELPDSTPLPKEPSAPVNITEKGYTPAPANPDTPVTITVRTDAPPKAPLMLHYKGREVALQGNGNVSTAQVTLSKDFGVTSAAGGIDFVILQRGATDTRSESFFVEYSRFDGRQAVHELYDKFKAGYSGRNDAVLRSLISDDWQSDSDGTTLSDLEANLRRSFKIYNQIVYSISNLQITPAGDGQKFRVSYDVQIKGIIFQNNIRHEEKSSVVEEVVVDQNGKAKIAKTLTGKFWSTR